MLSYDQAHTTDVTQMLTNLQYCLKERQVAEHDLQAFMSVYALILFSVPSFTLVEMT